MEVAVTAVTRVGLRVTYLSGQAVGEMSSQSQSQYFWIVSV